MNSKERAIMEQWLVSPLDDKAAELVKTGRQYWAACVLYQKHALDPVKQLEGLKTVCLGPAKKGLIDARAFPFMLFGGTQSDPYSKGSDWGGKYLDQGVLTQAFSAIDVVDSLKQHALNHLESAELADQISILADQIVRDAPEARHEVYRSLYVLVCELQRESQLQRRHVIWQVWSELFQSLSWRKGFGKRVAMISYLLNYSLFDGDELRCVKMRPTGASADVWEQNDTPPWEE